MQSAGLRLPAVSCTAHAEKGYVAKTAYRACGRQEKVNLPYLIPASSRRSLREEKSEGPASR